MPHAKASPGKSGIKAHADMHIRAARSRARRMKAAHALTENEVLRQDRLRIGREAGNPVATCLRSVSGKTHFAFVTARSLPPSDPQSVLPDAATARS